MTFRIFVALAWGRRIWDRLARRRRTVYVDGRIDEYRALWSTAAEAVGATFVDLQPGVWEVRRADHVTRIANDLVQFDDPVILALAGDKSYCYELAARVGLPTPDPKTYQRDGLEDVLARTSGRIGPLVVKPARNTSAGVGVSVGITSRFELADAMALASIYSDRVIIERMVAAETVRLLFLDGEMISAVRRSGVRVVGDGVASVSVLLGRMEPRPVPADRFVDWTLAQQGRSLDDIVPAGEALIARWLPRDENHTHELRTIYGDDVTSSISPELAHEVAPLVGALGTRFAGVDLLTNDISRPLAESGGVFLEINTTPGLHHHCTPSRDGSPCSVTVAVLDRLLGSRPG